MNRSILGILNQRGFFPEEESVPLVDDSETTLADGTLVIGNRVSVPTKHEFYIVSASEWKNGTVNSGNVLGGACIVDAEPPVATQLNVIAFTDKVVQSPISDIQKENTIYSAIVKGGTEVTGFIVPDNAIGNYRFDTIASRNTSKATFGNQLPPALSNVTAWGASIVGLYLKLYFRGIG